MLLLRGRDLDNRLFNPRRTASPRPKEGTLIHKPQQEEALRRFFQDNNAPIYRMGGDSVVTIVMIEHHAAGCEARGWVRPDMLRGLSCLTSPKMAKGRYETPPASELHRLMWTKKGTSGHLDEVQPRIYIGDMYAAKDKRTLKAHRITHVLNAADGKFSVNTGASFYRDTSITYHGVEAFDMPTFDLSPFFYPAANFIKNALSSPTGKVFVHCAMGLSRSSTLVLAYLMIHENMTLVDALKAVSANRNICPNDGFLEQLRELDKKLNYQRR